MNLVAHLIIDFFKEEKMGAVVMFITSILVNVIQTNGISTVIAKIVNTASNTEIKKPELHPKMMELFWLIVILSVSYLIILFIYRIFQSKLITKLRQWIRLKLTNLLLNHNNENFTDKNFVHLNSPINRISNICFMFVNDMFSVLIPNLSFLIVISGFFIYNNWKMGILFILANLLIVLYIITIYPTIIDKNETYENDVISNEAYLLELLGNFDKIIYRGQTNEENERFKAITQKTVNTSYDFYYYMNFHETLMSFMVYFIIFIFLFYNIRQLTSGNITVILFIIYVTMIGLYRDKIEFLILQITQFVEFLGRTQGVITNFNEIDYNQTTNYDDPTKKNIMFNKIVFKDVTFKYRTSDKNTLQSFNLELNTENKIIGITGKSGRGKSTFVKLMLKMYQNYTGEITIDDVNIRELDPDFIRKNVIYVNQNSKLFDRLIVENIMYGCNDPHKNQCDDFLRNVLEKYPKIKELFKDNDIYSTRVGPLGEKMSGGQRVIISILTGLITPSVGLILDEPTVGLDPSLKVEVLQLIQEQKKHKKFIIIITHDNDVGRITNEIYDI